MVRVSLPKPASSATGRPAYFRKVDSAMSVFLGPALLVGSAFAGPDFQVCPVALVFGSAVPASFRRVLLVGLAFAGPDFQVCPVALVFGSAVPASFGRALSVGLADSGFQACSAALVTGPAVPVSSGWALLVGLVHRAWVAVVLGGGRLDDFQDGWAPAGSRDDSEAYSAGDDSPNYHGSLDGWPTQSVADDTRRAADDKDSTNRSSSRGCNRRGAIPSSIPIHPIPKAGYQPAAPQFQSPLRN